MSRPVFTNHSVNTLATGLSLFLAVSFCRADTLLFSDMFDTENGGIGQFNYAGFVQWNVTRDDVDLIGSPGVGDFYPGHGLYVDLDGSPGRGRMESKSVFDLLPGRYRLSFEIGNNPYLGSLLQLNHVRVGLADVFLEDFSRDGVTPLDPVTRLISVGSSTSGKIVFESLDPTDFAGVVIDDVRLEFVPEPASLAFVAVGLGLVGLRCHWRPNYLLLSSLVVLLVSSSTHATDRIYTLVPYEFADSRFGFSGTITTDGSSGVFSEVNFIKDWSITVHTPSDFDGISTEVFTPATGLSLALEGRGSIEVTQDTIAILESGGDFSGRTLLSLGKPSVDTTAILWSGAYTVYPQPGVVTNYLGRRLAGNVRIIDYGEGPDSEIGYYVSPTDSLLVATGGVAVPEPTSFTLASLSVLALVSRISRKL